MDDGHPPPMGYSPGLPPYPTGEERSYIQIPRHRPGDAPPRSKIDDTSAVGPALILLRQIAAACVRGAENGVTARFDLSGLNAENRALIAETLGQGEVCVHVHGFPAMTARESRFAGVWMLSGTDVDKVEVAPFPTLAGARAADPIRVGLGADAPKSATVLNAPAIYAELRDRSERYTRDTDLHVVNLSLLPHTEADLIWLDAAFGEGSVTMLSHGYGHCRITATAQPNLWRVQFFNEMDALILDTFEVTAMPEVVIAAEEDLSDSAERLLNVLEAIT